MEFRTVVDIPKLPFQREPLQQLLFVGSCFADSIGQRFAEEHFPVTVNPFGTMYNPASVLHTVEQLTTLPLSASLTPPPTERNEGSPPIAFLTLGTNHVYRLKATGEIVDNCQKRPQQLFTEEELTVTQCTDLLEQTVETLRRWHQEVQVVVTVSPIRYAKYGYHGSQLSKATLLLAADELCRRYAEGVSYFPAYELVCDELRDYRFYQPDMLHPSQQTVDYIWERLVEVCFSPRAKQFLQEWRPIRQALNHRPFRPDSPEYQTFLAEAQKREQELLARYT